MGHLGAEATKAEQAEGLALERHADRHASLETTGADGGVPCR